MKHVKKLLAVVMSAALAMAMCVSAFAATVEIPNATIKVNDENGNTYSVYKVMEVTDPKAPAYAPVAPFGDFFTDPNTEYELDANNQIKKKGGEKLFGTSSTTESDARWTNTNKSETAKLATALANWARENNNAQPVKELTAGTTETLPAGFYLVVETGSGSSKKTEVASKPILVDLLNGNAEITPKNDFVDLDKVIVEEGNKEVEANSAQIGDVINYKVTTSTPQYQANVNEGALKFELTDEFSKGLTYTGPMVVKAGDSTLTENTDYKVFEDGQNIKIAFSRSWLKANQGKTVTLTYSATLNKDAVVNDKAGNPNTVKLNYSNNPGQIKDDDLKDDDLPDQPNDDEDIPSKELEDSVKTYTYGIDVIKVDGKDNHDLPGAEFTLSKGDELIEFVKTTDKDGNDIYRVATQEEKDDASIKTTTTVTSKDGGTKAIITGLDADTYELTETKAPDKYTVLEKPITVTIEEKEGDIEKTVIEKEYDKDGNLINTTEKTEKVKGPTGEAKITVDSVAVMDEDGNTSGVVEADDAGHIEMKVIVPNEKGVSMPETGSRTAMYCMIGGAAIVVLGAGYYLMGARRNKKEQ